MTIFRSSPYYLHPKRIDTWTVANPLYAYVHLCWIWGFHFLKVGTSRLGASGFGYHRSTANLSRTFGAGAHEARGRENATLSMHTFWKCGPSIRVSGGWGVYFLGSHLEAKHALSKKQSRKSVSRGQGVVLVVCWQATTNQNRLRSADDWSFQSVLHCGFPRGFLCNAA